MYMYVYVCVHGYVCVRVCVCFHSLEYLVSLEKFYEARVKGKCWKFLEGYTNMKAVLLASYSLILIHQNFGNIVKVYATNNLLNLNMHGAEL